MTTFSPTHVPVFEIVSENTPQCPFLLVYSFDLEMLHTIFYNKVYKTLQQGVLHDYY